MSFSGYTIDSECTSWEPIARLYLCKPATWGGAQGSNNILSNIMASKKDSTIERPTELTRTSLAFLAT